MTAKAAFEAVMIAFKKDKNGNVITLAIHPQETPEILWRLPIGQRFGVALVPLDEEAEAHADEEMGLRAFKLAGVKCRDKQFQGWLFRRAKVNVADANAEELARDLLKAELGIASSTEIRDNPRIREKFLELMSQYDEDKIRPKPR